MIGTYEVRFGIAGKKTEFQQCQIFTVKADSYADALNKFIVWANNGEEKRTYRGKLYKFEKYPVDEDNVVNITRLAHGVQEVYTFS